METVIRNRHERLLSLCNTDVVDTENMLCSYKIKLAILGKLQSSVKNYIIDCLSEFFPKRYFMQNGYIEDVVEHHSSSIKELPNITPNGLVLPKLDVLWSYNNMLKAVVALVKSLGLHESCESANMPINVRLKWGMPPLEIRERPYASVKWHSDIWAGACAQSVMLHIPLFGDFVNNGINFAETPSEFYPDYTRALTNFDDGQPAVENRREYNNLVMEVGKAYLVDSFLLHRTAWGNPSFRGIVSFPLKPHKKLDSDIYINDARTDNLVPMKEWVGFGKESVVTTLKPLEKYTGEDIAKSSYADTYNFMSIK